MNYLNRLRRSGINTDGIQRFWNIKKSHGSYLYEKDTGRKFIDFATGYGSLPLGWNHPILNDKMSNIDISVLSNKVANSDIYTESYLDFVESFHNHVNPSSMSNLFLIDGGALAIDNAIKTCFHHHTNGSLSDNDSQDLEILSLPFCFHGRSGYPLSLTDSQPIKTAGFPKHKWTKLNYAPIETDTQDTIEDSISHMNHIFEKKRDKLAGFIIEGGVQCEGGDRHLSTRFCKHLQLLSDEYNIPIIVDEVQTGFWSTGNIWGYQSIGIKPDIIVFGKKSQQCGFLAGGKLKGNNNIFNYNGRLNSTWGGNLFDMVRSKIIIDIILEEKLSDNVKYMEKIYIDQMRSIQIQFPFILNVRAKGVLMAFDLDNTVNRDEFMKELENLGLLALSAGCNTVRLRPHLASNLYDLNNALEIIETCCKIVEKKI